MTERPSSEGLYLTVPFDTYCFQLLDHKNQQIVHQQTECLTMIFLKKKDKL